MATQPQPRPTPAEYLARERACEQRHEYFDGELFAMGGASRRHGLIVLNIGSELRTQLRERPCEAFANDMRVKVSASGLYTYPDVVVVCGVPRFEDSHVDTLLNPTLIVEVLSPSTEAYDRGRKFDHYRTLESLREYLLAEQDSPRLMQYTRQDNDHWLFTELRGDAGQLTLPSIDCTLSLSDVYHKVTFDQG